MGFPGSSALDFATAVQNTLVDVDEFVKETADCYKAQATVEADLVKILMKIDESMSMDSFNELLREHLMAHLVYCAIHTQVRHADDTPVSVASVPPSEANINAYTPLGEVSNQPWTSSVSC